MADERADEGGSEVVSCVNEAKEGEEEEEEEEEELRITDLF